ncbi:type II secretion system F family protein [Candidatus Micrarchaeota archaeon]|nr:type II secretion system F family protein [Candidatus Micrarchaeota archaeon]
MANQTWTSDALKNRPLRRLSYLYPEGFIASFSKKLVYAGVSEDPRVYVGRRTLFGFLMSLVLLLILDAYLYLNYPYASFSVIFNKFSLYIFGLFFLGIFGTLALTYLEIYFKIVDRATYVEKLMPDFLSLVVSNLRAGMPPFTAFISSARPEFGDFSKVVLIATANASGSQSLSDSFSQITQSFESPILDRVVSLFVKGVKSGAHLSKLLVASADEIRHIQDLRSELATSTRTYTIFLAFIVIIVMPFLLSVSNQFIIVFLSINPAGDSGFDPQLLANMPSFSGAISVSPDQMFMISISALLLTNVFVAILIGLIGRGRVLYGLKYFPFFSGASIVMFFITKSIIGSMFSSFAI